MKKILALAGISIAGLAAVWFAFVVPGKPFQPSNPAGTSVRGDTPNMVETLVRTRDMAREYAQLRYRTDKILTEAEKYSGHAAWNAGMTQLVRDWEAFSLRANRLQDEAEKFQNAQKKPNVFSVANAAEAPRTYDKDEISTVFDRAPAGKKIATLAKHLGVDAKTAARILQEDQEKVTAEAWKREETFRKLETSATVIKDAAKVTVFVWTIVATGWAAGFAAGSVVTKAGIIVSGADLIMEVTDDAARIGLGDGNKISAITSGVRTVTEPLAGILSIADLPENMTKGIEKLSATNFGAEQLNSVIQDGKILGVKLPAAGKKTPAKLTPLKPEDAAEWVLEQGAKTEAGSDEERVAKILGTEKAPPTETASTASAAAENESATGSVSGNFTLVPKDQPIGNDWQAAMRISLFQSAPIEIRDNAFSVSHSAPYSFGNFTGFGEIRLQGAYDPKTGTIEGTHYRKYEGTVKGAPQTLIYSGRFKQAMPPAGETVKIQFSGTIEHTRTDGKGKPQTTTSEGGSSQIFTVSITGSTR